MARKTAIRITNAEARAEEYKTDARKDAPSAPSKAGLLPSLAEMRAARGQMTETDLLKLCKSAARLEMRGAMYSADDRLDVAADIMAAVLTETGGAMPRTDSERVKLGRLCGDAKNRRRSIDARRQRDQLDAETRAAEYALSSAAIGADHTPARHVAIVARAGELAAARAATAVCAELGLDVAEDSPAWTVFYVWTRGASPEVCAAERGATWGTFRVRMTRGAKFVRGFYGVAELVSKLTLGATLTDDGLVYVCEDASREAHNRTPIMAPDWRADAKLADDEITTSRCKVRPKRARERAKGDVLAETARALASLGRTYAIDAERRGARERSATRDSALAPSVRAA